MLTQGWRHRQRATVVNAAYNGGWRLPAKSGAGPAPRVSFCPCRSSGDATGNLPVRCTRSEIVRGDQPPAARTEKRADIHFIASSLAVHTGEPPLSRISASRDPPSQRNCLSKDPLPTPRTQASLGDDIHSDLQQGLQVDSQPAEIDLPLLAIHSAAQGSNKLTSYGRAPGQPENRCLYGHRSRRGPRNQRPARFAPHAWSQYEESRRAWLSGVPAKSWRLHFPSRPALTHARQERGADWGIAECCQDQNWRDRL